MTALELEKKKEDFIVRFRQSTDAERINRTIECFDIESLLQDDDPEIDKVWDALPFFGPKTAQEAEERIQRGLEQIKNGQCYTWDEAQAMFDYTIKKYAKH